MPLMSLRSPAFLKDLIYFTQADIVIAIIFFTSAFNYLFGLIVFITMVVYLGKKETLHIILNILK